MKQDINLYQPRFRPQRLWLSARQLLVLLLGLSLLLALSGYWLRERLAAAELHAAELQQRKQALQQDLAALQKKLDALLADDQWATRENRLRRQIRNYHRVIDYVAERQFGGGAGFSPALLALAGVRSEAVWLEQIRLADRDLYLQGAALEAAAVPRYFDQLRRSQAFPERSFEDFEILRSPQYDWKLEFKATTRVERDDE